MGSRHSSTAAENGEYDATVESFMLAIDDTRGNFETESIVGEDPATVVRARGIDECSVQWADMSRLLAYEVFMGHLPLQTSGIFAVACLLGPLTTEGIQKLRDGLEVLISARPQLAGRICGKYIAMCNAGVPFTQIDHSGPCPNQISHVEVLSLCDVRDPLRVMKGYDPVLTTTIHVHPDGAILGVAASHCFMDGSSLFAFLNAWGRACRGDTADLDKVGHRSSLQNLLRNEDCRATSEKYIPRMSRKLGNGLDKMNPHFGTLYRNAEASVLKAGSKMSLIVASHMVPKFLKMATQQTRVLLSLSHARLSEMKTHATPPKEADGDGWVSTQEAIVAHLVHCLWQHFSPPVKGVGVFGVSFMVDVRKHLGISESHAFGTGFQVYSMYLKDMHNKHTTVQACAATIHEESKSMAAAAAKRWCLWHRAFEYRVDTEEFIQDMKGQVDSDMSITINNNSKRQAPDFGPEAGGVATEFMSNMGPTLLIATRDGMDVILQGDVIVNATEDQMCSFKSSFCGLQEPQ